jgi:hypothetical protein
MHGNLVTTRLLFGNPGLSLVVYENAGGAKSFSGSPMGKLQNGDFTGEAVLLNE